METNTIYNVDYFIKKFEVIPSELWITGMLTGQRNPECHCALGHCGYEYWNTEENNKEGLALISLFKDFTDLSNKVLETNNEEIVGEEWVTYINDNYDFIDEIKGNTPKERILNYLYQIRDKQS